MTFRDKVKINIKIIFNLWFKFVTVIFSLMGTLSIFITFDDLKITNLLDKVIILICIIVVCFIISFFGIVWILKELKLWGNGKNKLLACYGDIFEEKKKRKKIVVIPVNDTFETIIDDSLDIEKPLVSKNTLHGLWITKMLNKGLTEEEIEKKINNYLVQNQITGTEIIKERGKNISYPIGTVVPFSYNNITYYLLVISKFDSSNKAKSSRKEIRDSVDGLLEYYDENGQGYPMYIPLIGTGSSRTEMSHQQAFKLLKSTILTNENYINGVMTIVVYNGDKDKVSIFK